MEAMKILMLDNYDSFTYNLVGMVEEISGLKMDVKRNDEMDLIEVGPYDKIILSPGPGLPTEAGNMLQLIHKYGPEKSILGICLGMQAIGEVYGARLINLPQVYHGVSRQVRILEDDTLFQNLDGIFLAGRYHSWALDNESFPEDQLIVTARDQDGLIMGVRHREYDVCGLQFHPESILTPDGHTILKSWIQAPVKIAVL